MRTELKPSSSHHWERTLYCDPANAASHDIVDEVKLASGTAYKNVAVTACKEFDANGLKGSFTYWFAKDVGMVKQEWQQGKSGKFICELEKFEKEKK